MTARPVPAHPPRAENLRGVVLLLLAMAILPFLDVVAKFLGQKGVPILMIVWARMAFGALLTLPFAVRIAGSGGLWPDWPLFHLIRAAFLIGATFFFFWSLKFLGIAEALAIFFVQPLVVTALSPVVLGEKVGVRRWAAVAVGFAGTLIILRPGLSAIGAGQMLAFGSGVCLALYMLVTRRMAGQSHAVVTMFHTSLMGGIMTSAVLPFVWQAPDAVIWAQFLLVGLLATAGHILITRAYDHAEASLLAPLAYTEIVMATVAGWWFFGDLPDGWTFVGVAILIGSAIYISARERAATRSA